MAAVIFILIGLAIFVSGLVVWATGSRKRAVASRKEATVDRYGRDGRSDELDAAAGWTLAGMITAGVGLIFALIFIIMSVFVTNGVGEAKVYTNIDGTIAFTQEAPGIQVKAPWQEYQNFDLFSQEVLYAGAPQGGGPDYSGGTVSGAEVTVAVGGINGGSTQGFLDISVTYSIDAESVEEIYSNYRNQERFTKQVIEKTILSTIREIPAQYTAVEFRGEKRAEASDLILETLNDRLSLLGVQIDFVNIQDIRYSESVEEALREVENASQAVQRAEADQRRIEVEAETARIRAQGEADANRILEESLSDDVLLKLYIEALREAGAVYVVPDGSSPLVTIK